MPGYLTKEHFGFVIGIHDQYKEILSSFECFAGLALGDKAIGVLVDVCKSTRVESHYRTWFEAKIAFDDVTKSRMISLTTFENCLLSVGVESPSGEQDGSQYSLSADVEMKDIVQSYQIVHAEDSDDPSS